MTTVTEQTFFAGLKEAMEQNVREALEAEIDAACDRLRATLRARVGQIALSMMDHYSVQTMGRELVITVRSPS